MSILLVAALIGNTIVVPFVRKPLLLAGYAAGGMTASLITLAACVVLFAVMNVIAFVKFKRKQAKGQRLVRNKLDYCVLLTTRRVSATI